VAPPVGEQRLHSRASRQATGAYRGNVVYISVFAAMAFYAGTLRRLRRHGVLRLPLTRAIVACVGAFGVALLVVAYAGTHFIVSAAMAVYVLGPSASTASSRSRL
jgi:hypothetical protein